MTGSSRWEMIIVGAGPAGAVAAYQAARRGAQVLLIDKAAFPRWKVCGCCLNGAALNTLEDIGLGGLTAKLGGRRLSRLSLYAGRRHVHVPLPTGIALSRGAFDLGLVEEATRAGAVFQSETHARLLTTRGPPELELTRAGEITRVRPAVLLVADGLAGSVLDRHPDFPVRLAPGARLGAGAVLPASRDFAEGVIHMAVGPAGYVGLVKLENGMLDIAAALHPHDVRAAGHPAAAAAAVLSAAGLPVSPGFYQASWKGTPALTRRRRRLAGHRILVLGDSAGYIEPFTGEGMAWAMRGAAAAGPLACEGIENWTPAIERQWHELFRRTVKSRQRVCRVAANLLSRPSRPACSSSD